MHPEAGVTLLLNREDGTLRIKGKQHFEWFRNKFRNIVDTGSKDMAKCAEMNRVLDRYLRIDDGYSVSISY